MIDIIVGLIVLSVVWLVVWGETAPDGYQDESGFHYGVKKKD